MIKIGTILIALFVGAVAGYFISQAENIVQPNYRWIQIFNKTGCPLKTTSILFPDRSITVTSEQTELSVFPSQSEAEMNIPVLASDNQEYRIKLDFQNCETRITESQSFSAGTYVQVSIYENEIGYSYR